jgi:hypothetical protein
MSLEDTPLLTLKIREVLLEALGMYHRHLCVRPDRNSEYLEITSGLIEVLESEEPP